MMELFKGQLSLDEIKNLTPKEAKYLREAREKRLHETMRQNEQRMKQQEG